MHGPLIPAIGMQVRRRAPFIRIKKPLAAWVRAMAVATFFMCVCHTNRRFSTTLRIVLPSPSQFSGHSQLGEVGRLSSGLCVHTLWLRARPLLAACAILSNVYLHALHSHAGERSLQDKPDAIFASLWAHRSDLSRASLSIDLRCSPHTPSLIIYPLSLAHKRARQKGNGLL